MLRHELFKDIFWSDKLFALLFNIFFRLSSSFKAELFLGGLTLAWLTFSLIWPWFAICSRAAILYSKFWNSVFSRAIFSEKITYWDSRAFRSAGLPLELIKFLILVKFLREISLRIAFFCEIKSFASSLISANYF